MPIGKPTRRISGVTVIKPGTGEVIENQDILIDGGRIKEIEPAGNSKIKSAVDGEGLFAIPGLIDTHVHTLGLFTENLPGPFDIGWIVRQHLKNLAGFLRSGVTTIRDVGAPANLIRLLSRRAERFAIKSPRIFFAGPVLTVPGGYPYFVPDSQVALEYLTGPIC
ncbi:MAG: amidohydrolase family protein, partial [bacterium]